MAKNKHPPPPPHFSNGTDTAGNWKLFKRRWDNFSILSKVEENSFADDALKVYEGFCFDTPLGERTVAEVLTKLNEYAVGEANETYERFVFNRRCQEEGESYENVYTDLRVLIKSCNYCTQCLDSMLRDRIVIDIRHPATHELLKVRKLTLQQCIDLCRAAESAYVRNRELNPVCLHKVTSSDSSVSRDRDRIKTRASEAMALVAVRNDNFERISMVTEGEFEHVFNGELGSLPGVHHLNTDLSVKPVVMPARRIPIAIQPKLREELTRL
ncbi:hypothetical protein Pcinc_008086 [Petrolisthes cinctipes]|uniref:Uncharacterized protein n=1 Tax=Petrolisthes cinctipes TaxID=88211 RepID=A0AAE1G9Y9_PETCI|nr:hypothetical protein Pcinc_008086 [Petrolisthes cinctipes]